MTLGAVVALAALVAASVAFGLTTTQRTPEAPTTTTVRQTEAARELRALLEKDRAATFHAQYTGTSTEQAGAALRIETWRKPPRVRHDSELRAGPQVLRTRALLLEDRAISCAELGGAPWKCRTGPRPSGLEGDPLLGGIHEELGRSTVTARDDTEGGRRVRCFVLAAEGRTSELCAAHDGVPVTVTVKGTTVRLVSVDDSVPDDVFVPPAPPESGPA